jgi:hypothetical protein
LYTQLASLDVQQWIDNQLSGAMVGYLAAPVYVNDRYIACIMQVFLLAVAPECEHWRMLKKPDFVRGIGMAGIGKDLHIPPGGLVISQTKLSDRQGGWCRHAGAALFR